MARLPTYPFIYDEALQINIAMLKEWGYLCSNQIKSGTLTWSRKGMKTGSISIYSNMYNEPPYVELDYKYNDEPRNYKINLVYIPSNLGFGKIWYFQCPVTNKRCWKLYSIGGYFLHRDAFQGAMYDSQIQSKYYRSLDKSLGAYFRLDQLYEQLYKKYFKKTYAGKPTKRYLRIMEQIEHAESIPIERIERLMVFGK